MIMHPFRRTSLLTILLFFAATSLLAQDGEVSSEASWTETETEVQALIGEEGTHVVHFWAPWCHNSRHEFRQNVWGQVIEAHPDINYIFVTVYNNGELSEDMLERYDLLDKVTTFAQPDHGSSRTRANRRRSFMDLPITWTPTTWIFHNGKLAAAFNYGEVDAELMNKMLDWVAKDWNL